jgi:hypothetical protein
VSALDVINIDIFTHFDGITHANFVQNSPSTGGSLQDNPEYESACLGGRKTLQHL